MPALERRGFDVVFRSFLDDGAFRRFYDPAPVVGNAIAVARGAVRQLMSTVGSYDAVFVQREAALIGPPMVEWILSAARRVPLFFDFDDPVWLDASGSSVYPRLARLIRNPAKAWSLIRRARHVFAGSGLLATEARRVNGAVTVVPSVVSRSIWTPLPGKLDGNGSDPPLIGWIGTHSTAPYLEMARSALVRLRSEGHAFRVRVVGAGRGFDLPGLEIERRPWSAERDVLDFQELDIGLAPMRSDRWSEGKCAFKQVQYMAVGVPCVSSLVGGARDFVVHERNALVAEGEDEWYVSIRRLLVDRELRARLARAGRALVEERMCTEVQSAIIAETIDRSLTA